MSPRCSFHIVTGVSHLDCGEWVRENIISCLVSVEWTRKVESTFETRLRTARFMEVQGKGTLTTTNWLFAPISRREPFESNITESTFPSTSHILFTFWHFLSYTDYLGRCFKIRWGFLKTVAWSCHRKLWACSRTLFSVSAMKVIWWHF